MDDTVTIDNNFGDDLFDDFFGRMSRDEIYLEFTGKLPESSASREDALDTNGPDHELLAAIPNDRIWTLVNGDDCQTIGPSHHYVNLDSYVISVIPRTTDLYFHWQQYDEAEVEELREEEALCADAGLEFYAPEAQIDYGTPASQKSRLLALQPQLSTTEAGQIFLKSQNRDLSNANFNPASSLKEI